MTRLGELGQAERKGRPAGAAGPVRGQPDTHSNQNGTVDPCELQSLAALGIASISLVGSGNSGESIAGSAVTNRTSYTTSSGAVGEVAAVDLSTDTTGDVFTTATGGVTITSTPEGGPTPTTSFVDQSASAQSYTLSGGTLTDQTTGGDITVNPTDPTSSWLGGETGAGTLTGEAGNTVFLVNAKTVVHGGTGFNIVPTLRAIAMLPRRCHRRGGGKHRARSSSAPPLGLLRGTHGKAGKVVAR